MVTSMGTPGAAWSHSLACEVGALVALAVGVAAVAWLVGVVAGVVAVGVGSR